MGSNCDLVSQSINILSGIRALINLHLYLHSCIWIEICVEVDCLNEFNRSVHVSYWMGSWKCVMNANTRVWKMLNEYLCSSIYQLVVVPIKVLWNNLNWMESSINEFEEHHKWYVLMWFFGSSLGFPSNLGILDGNLTRIDGEFEAWNMESFVKHDRSGRSNVAR